MTYRLRVTDAAAGVNASHTPVDSGGPHELLISTTRWTLVSAAEAHGGREGALRSAVAWRARQKSVPRRLGIRLLKRRLRIAYCVLCNAKPTIDYGGLAVPLGATLNRSLQGSA